MATARWVKVNGFSGSGTGMSLADIAFSTTGSGSPTDQATTVTGSATDDGGAILNLIDNTSGTTAAWSDFGTPYVELVFEIDAADVGVTHIGIRPTACDARDPAGFSVSISSDGTNYGPTINYSNSGCSAGTFQWYVLPPLVSEMWVRTIICPRDSNLIDLTEIQFDFNGVGSTLTPVTMTSSPAPTTGSLTTLYNSVTVESAVQFTGSTTVIAKCTSTVDMIGTPNAIRMTPTSPTANFPFAIYSDYSTTSASGPWTHAGGSVGELASNYWWIDPSVTFSVCPAGDTLLNTTSAVDNMTYTVRQTGSLTEAFDGTDATLLAPAYALAATAAITDTPAGQTLTMYLESIGLGDVLTSSAHTTASVLDAAAIVAVVQQAINQIAADTAAGSSSFSLGSALALVDIANAAMTQASTYTSVMLVAEVIATIEALSSVGSEDIADTGGASDTPTR